jgi:hypothetical protein
MPFKMPRQMGAAYSPLYFLASVGAGGIAVTFFMYLLFWVPHPGRTVPNFEDIAAFLRTAAMSGQVMVYVALAGIALAGVMNLRLLAWNIAEFKYWQQHEIFEKHQESNAQTQVKAMPLALAMSVNVLFIAGLVFVPGLWTVVEYLFPAAILAFLLIGVIAFRHTAQFLGRVMTRGGFDFEKNNSFAQLLPAFAFSMIGVGLAAPAAMSGNALTVAVSLIASSFFMVTAIVMAAVAMVLGIRAMIEYGAAEETAPTLLIVIPILTVLGILMLRQDHGLHTTFQGHSTAIDTFMLLAKLLSAQVLFLLLGGMVLRRQDYARKFLGHERKSAGSYALVCPGIALAVMIHFFLNKGLVAIHVVDKYSAAYWAITAIALASQFAMIWLVLKLNRQHFSAPLPRAAAVPAE